MNQLESLLAVALPALARVEAERPGNVPHPLIPVLEARTTAAGLEQQLGALVDFGLMMVPQPPSYGGYLAHQRAVLVGQAQGMVEANFRDTQRIG